MGKEGKESSSNALAVQLDAEGKVKYDVIARQGHSKDKVNLKLSLTFYLQSEWLKLKITFRLNIYSHDIVQKHVTT